MKEEVEVAEEAAQVALMQICGYLRNEDEKLMVRKIKCL